MYRANATAGMIAWLGDQLHVSPESLERLGVGWKFEDSAWIFPERNADGQVIGLLRRFQNGKKATEKGHNRGLVFAPVGMPVGYCASRQRWIRVTRANPCPICGRPKWCSVDGSADPPRFVRCMWEDRGARYNDSQGGHIHELVPGAFREPAAVSSPLSPSADPVLVVEGASDTAAAMDLGFIAVGKPAATGGSDLLRALLSNRDVVVLGENDAGAGEKGMEATFLALQPVCKSVRKLRPPADVKDLREWKYRSGLDHEAFLEILGVRAEAPPEGDIVESDAPLALARRWLQDDFTQPDGLITLRKFQDVWYAYNGRYYVELNEDTDVRGRLYRYLDRLTVSKNTAKGTVLEPYRPTRAKVGDVVDALLADCPITADPPCWIGNLRAQASPSLVVFTNGILDLNHAVSGNMALAPLTPRLFHLGVTPYPFDSTATCPTWLRFLAEVFNGDRERIALLQEWLGYNLTADTRYQKMLLMVGRPGSGKGTTLAVLYALLGRDQCVQSSFHDLTSSFGLQPLLGKRAIILPDAHVPRSVDSMHALEVLKRLVGNDPVSVNRKFLPQLPEVRLHGRITIAVNELPELPDHARSLERRLLLLYYPNSFEGREDWRLSDKLCAEAPGIAVWAIEGLCRLRAQNGFTIPESSIPILREFRSQLSPVAEFLDECCELGDALRVPVQQLFDCWMSWCRERGSRPGHRAKFSEHVLHQKPELQRERMRLSNTQRPWVFVGLGLQGTAKERYLAR